MNANQINHIYYVGKFTNEARMSSPVRLRSLWAPQRLNLIICNHKNQNKQ